MIVLGKTLTGEVIPVQVDLDGVVQVEIVGSNMTNALLDGTIHNDTKAGSPVEGDLIVGYDDAGVIKWNRLARGAAGKVLVVQSDNSLAWQSVSTLEKIVQKVALQDGAVATGTTVMPLDNTIPQNTEGIEFMTLAITPTNVNNILEIEVTAILASSVIAHMGVALFQDTTANALAAAMQAISVAGNMNTINFIHRMVAGTTSSTTFKVRAGGHAAGTTTFNGRSSAGIFGGVLASSIVITEYLP